MTTSMPPLSASEFVDACEAGDTTSVRQRLAEGADPNTADRGFSALYVASGEGHDGAVSLLLEAGAKVDRPNQNGTTPLAALGPCWPLSLSQNAIYKPLRILPHASRARTRKSNSAGKQERW
jgi:ankyrin repeat protein